ncbi:MAG: hypothetical protein M1455_10300 [Actinobacteria bacterium]|nr:hypothetical protein [Actinomycetota bacterium]
MRPASAIRELIHGEEGSFVSTFVFLAIVVAIIAVAVIDGTSCLYAKNAADDVTQEAANLAFDDYQMYRNDAHAENIAAAHCEEKDLQFVDFRVNRFQGHTFDVTCAKDAKTYAFKHIPILKELIHQQETRTSSGVD